MRTSSRPRSMSRSRSSRARSRSWSALMRWSGRPRRGRSRSTARSRTTRTSNMSSRSRSAKASPIADGRRLARCELAFGRGRIAQEFSSRPHDAGGHSYKPMEAQRLRPRGHDRSPPDAQARRVLRRAAAAAARRHRHHRRRHRPGPHGARPWRRGFLRLQGGGHRPRVRGQRRPASTATTGRGCRAAAASSTPSSTRPTGRSARTCARLARCSPRARTSRTAIRIRGGRRPR